jgi:type I restriction enzyme M protein
MRVLVAWRAFGDLVKCCKLVPEHERAFIAEIERERDTALAEIDAAYSLFLAPLPALRAELIERETLADKEPPEDREAKKRFREEKKANAERLKDLRRELKALERLEAEAEEKRSAARQQAEREIALVRETAADLLRIAADPAEARRYFAVSERAEIAENEFNLNVPRYVNTFEPEEEIKIPDALEALQSAEGSAAEALAVLRRLLQFNGAR